MNDKLSDASRFIASYVRSLKLSYSPLLGLPVSRDLPPLVKHRSVVPDLKVGKNDNRTYVREKEQTPAAVMLTFNVRKDK